MEMTSYLTSSKMPFTDKNGHLTKTFQKEKRDIASQLLKKCAQKLELSLIKYVSKKIDKIESVW